MEEFLKDLNPRQKDAVLAIEGPVLILAGPGSGKTKTLTHRIAHLLSVGIPPENILSVTFTNKAAEEMRERVHTLTSRAKLNIEGLFLGTFHALAARIIRTHPAAIGYTKTFTIFDEDDSLSLIKEVIKDLSINPKQFQPGLLLNTISLIKNELRTPEEYEKNVDLSDPFPKTLHAVYQNYQKRLFESNAMDFDDLLLYTNIIFEKYRDILEKYQERFRYINVDEWQDTNHAQYSLVSRLAEKHRNIAVVGDDAQSIYGWRGADFRNIQNFEKDWPDAKVIVLDQNYRSSQTILDAAREIITKNRQQKEKKLWTENGHGERIAVAVVENAEKEAEFVVNQIKDFLTHGYTLKDLVILYRTNAQSRTFEEILLTHKFPYKIIGGLRFYQRKEVKDILGYTRALVNTRDLESLKRIANIPPRGIGRVAFLAYLSQKENQLGKRELAALKNFKEVLHELKEETRKRVASEFLKYLLKKIRYQNYIEDDSTRSEERWENVMELLGLAKKYDDYAPPNGLEKLLEDVALVSDVDDINQGVDAIHLMTLHAAKGLEFPIVFMTGMEEGIFPHSRALFNPQDLEEERRLCYVGITRAKERVFLSCALRRPLFGSIQANPPSRFLSEIPDHLVDVYEEKLLQEIDIG